MLFIYVESLLEGIINNIKEFIELGSEKNDKTRNVTKGG